MTEDLQSIFNNHFKFLTEEWGFIIDKSNYNSNVFGNFVIELSKENKKIRIVSDRSQIFIDIFNPKEGWRNKEKVLESKGILRSRFESPNGLWDGYKIANQSNDLKKNKEYLGI